MASSLKDKRGRVKDDLIKKGPVKDKLTRFIAEPGKQEIVIERTFNAPLECIFRALTEPDFIPEWWGPRRLKTVVDKMDVKPGGTWRFIQHDASGKEYAFHGEYKEVLSPERLVSTSEYEDMPGHEVMQTVLLEEDIEQYVYGFEARTRMMIKDIFQSVEDRDGMLQRGMEEGVRESYDRLDELAARLCIRKKKAA